MADLQGFAPVDRAAGHFLFCLMCVFPNLIRVCLFELLPASQPVLRKYI